MPNFGKDIFPKLNPQDIKSLPIPKANNEKQTEIAEIVDKIIEAKKQDANADTKELEDKIDCLVYKLYGLTDEEIAIVEGGKKSKKAKVKSKNARTTKYRI